MSTPPGPAQKVRERKEGEVTPAAVASEKYPHMGKRLRDSVTGYEGIAVARTEYMSGCFHIDLERADDKGKPEHEWFDEERLGVVPDGANHKDKGRKRSPGQRDPGFVRP